MVRYLLGLERHTHFIQLSTQIFRSEKSRSRGMGGQEHILQPTHLCESSGCFQERLTIVLGSIHRSLKLSTPI